MQKRENLHRVKTKTLIRKKIDNRRYTVQNTYFRTMIQIKRPFMQEKTIPILRSGNRCRTFHPFLQNSRSDLRDEAHRLNN